METLEKLLNRILDKQVPQVSKKVCSKQQIQNTQGWTLERRFDIAVGEEMEEEEDYGTDSEEWTEFRKRIAATVPPFSKVEDGTLILLADVCDLTVVAVLPWDDGHKLVVPLSSHDFPASKRELKRLGEHPLRQEVFQIWNARTAPVEKIRGWVQERLHSDELEEIKLMLRWVLAGEPFPEKLRDRTGVSNPPRELFLPYLREERKKLESIEEDLEDFDDDSDC